MEPSVQYIALDVQRDVSGMINATIGLSRQLLRPVTKASLPMVLPFVAIAVIVLLGGTVFPLVSGNDVFASVNDRTAFTPMAKMSIIFAAVAMLCVLPAAFLLWNMMSIATLEYHRLKRVPLADEIREACRETRGVAFGTLLMTFLVSSLVNVVTHLLSLILPDAPVFALIMNLVDMALSAVLAVPLLMALTIRYQAGLSYRAAFSRGADLVEGMWGPSALFFFVVGLVIAGLWVAPMVVAIFMGAAFDATGAGLDAAIRTPILLLASIVAVGAGLVLAYVSVALYSISPAVLYFCRKERLEGDSLVARIDAIEAIQPDAPLEPGA